MLWTPPGMVVSLPGLSGSSRALLGQYSSSFCSEHFGMRSDAPDTCALSSGDVSLELAHGLLSPLSSRYCRWPGFGLKTFKHDELQDSEGESH